MVRERTVMFMLMWFAVAQCVARCSGEVQLDSNGYVGMLVAFAPDIAVENRHRTVLNAQELITRASKVLYKAIGISIKGVVFLFPLHWDLTRIFPSANVGTANSGEKFSSADVVVTAMDRGARSVFGNGPYTLQHNGCGSKGIRITVPSAFLLSGDITDSKAKALAKEWIKYRYGVFSESGFPNDPMYPLYYDIPGSSETNIQVTDCANVKVVYNFLNSGGGSCELKIDRDTGRPTNNSACRIEPDPFGNADVTSSLLSLHSTLMSVQHICGDQEHVHNEGSPNKQNVLCRSQSIWEVLKSHDDFKGFYVNPERNNLVEPPIFHYVQEQRLKIFMAVDNSSRLAHLKNILYNAAADLVYSLPAGSDFAYTLFAREEGVECAAQTELQTISPDLNNRTTLVLQTRPIKFSDSSGACLEYVLTKAIKVLAPNGLQSSGNIVLVTAHNPVNVGSELMRALELSGLCLTLILFPGADTEGFKQILSRAQCGSLSKISSGDSIETMRQIYGALNSVVESGLPVGPKETMLKMSEMNADESVSFTVDQSFRYFTVWVSDTSIDIARIDGQLDISADGPYIPEKLTTVFNFYVLRIRNFQATHWTCRLRQSTEFKSVLVKIMASEKESGIINADAWHEFVTARKVSEVEAQGSVKLYASLFQHNAPIANANVTAEVKPSDGRERIRLKLFDNGLGDPDVTRNDGIYSGYVVQLRTGEEYEVVVQMDDSEGKASTIAISTERGGNTCCGSIVPYDAETPTGSFSRQVQYRFKVTGSIPVAGYEPSRVNDLQVVGVTRPYHFTLQWTAPGGEKDSGRASSYQVLLFKTRQDALIDRGSITKGFKSVNDVLPEDYGALQNISVTLSPELISNKFYYIALRVLNGRGKSSLSNVVEVFLSQVIDTTTPDGTLGGTTTSGSAAGLSKTTVHVIVGVCLAAVVLIVTICVMFFFYVKRKERKSGMRNENGQTRVTTTAKDSDGDTNERDDGTVVASEWRLEREPINPLNSVPASVLMQHHQQVQEAKRRNKLPPTFTVEDFQEPRTSPQPPDGVVALASSPKLPRQQPATSSESSESARDGNPAGPRSYKEFKRQITSV